MRKIKALLAALVVLGCTSLFADDFDWSECWCNYGAGIEQGDMLLSVDSGVAWNFFDAFNAGGWAIPYVIADFEVAQPIWKLPFTFGGYVGFGLSGIRYGENGEKKYTNTTVFSGGSATYHMQMPPKNLDLYTGIKTGLIVNFASYYPNGCAFGFDWGYNIGASWYFTDLFGVNLELGYPMCKGGVVFKF